jgi:hypothetical protein
MRLLPPLALLLSTTVLLSCRHDRCEPAPSPPCFSGVVVGSTCTDGILIEVDGHYPIGQPVRARYFADSLYSYNIGHNVVATNTELGALGQPGQRISCTYSPDPAQFSGRYCLVFDGVASRVPHLVLSNVTSRPGRPSLSH